MSQNNVDYSGNPTGPELLDDYLTEDQENRLTCNSGIQRPSYAESGTFWLDTSSTPWVLKFYNGSIDVTIGEITTGSSGTFTVAGIDETNLLHKTGAETITGSKTFSTQAIFAKGTGLQIQGTDHNYVLRSSGSPYEGCALFLDNDTSKVAFNAGSTSITVGSANIIPLSVTQPASDNSTKIATTAFVKSASLTKANTYYDSNTSTLFIG